MESLSNDILWLILKKVIRGHFIKECSHNYIRSEGSNPLPIVPSDNCANCALVKNKLLEGLCENCYKLYRKGNAVTTATSPYGVTWTCGCGTCSQGEYYCSLHRYMNIKGPLGNYSDNYVLDDMGTNVTSLENLMSTLSIVNHRFQTLLRSKCIWYNTNRKIWGFNENLLED